MKILNLIVLDNLVCGTMNTMPMQFAKGFLKKVVFFGVPTVGALHFTNDEYGVYRKPVYNKVIDNISGANKLNFNIAGYSIGFDLSRFNPENYHLTKLGAHAVVTAVAPFSTAVIKRTF